MSEAGTGPCLVCQKITEKRCPECNVAFYCSPEHRKQDWIKHKGYCKAYELCVSQSGKFLKAARDIEPGEVILTEKPLVTGPRILKVLDGPFPCVGCCRTIANKDIAKECPGCGWPCCSTDCPGLSDVSRHALECKVLKLGVIRGVRTFYQYFRFDILVILRALHLQTVDNDKWNQLLSLNDNLDKRNPETEAFEKTNERVKFLEENFLKKLKPNDSESKSIKLQEVTSDLIHKLYGIFESNALTDPANENIILLYPTANSFEQNCIPNTCQIIDESHQITYRASLPIMKDEHLTSSYASLISGTHVRRKELSKRYLKCDCSRCRDPTELETFLSALSCMGMEKQPCRGIQLPLKPLDDKTKWVCGKCRIKLPHKEIIKFVDHLAGEVDKVLGNKPCVKELEDTLEKLAYFLHSNHYLVFKVKYDLVPLYVVGTKDDPKKQSDVASKKIALCNELIDIIKRLDPGNARLSNQLATLQKELIECKICILKQWFSQDTKDKYENDIKEVKTLFEDVKRTLLYESKTSIGSKLYSVVSDCDQQFKSWLIENNLGYN